MQKSLVSGITIDVARFKEKIPSIASAVGSLAADIAYCTPTPFDDMLAAQAGPLVQRVLEKITGTTGPLVQGASKPEPIAFANAESFGHAAESHMQAEAQNLNIKPEHIQLILSILKMFFPVLPFSPG